MLVFRTTESPQWLFVYLNNQYILDSLESSLSRAFQLDLKLFIIPVHKIIIYMHMLEKTI